MVCGCSGLDSSSSKRRHSCSGGDYSSEQSSRSGQGSGEEAGGEITGEITDPTMSSPSNMMERHSYLM